jgi:cob(I)alamin adenosyltransferase
MNRGYIQVYTGNGKGKTTAALGLAIRAAGAGLKVFFAQFLKGGEYSEHISLRKFKGLITVRRFGKKTFLFGKPSIDDLYSGKTGFLEVKKAVFNKKYDLIVMDEVFFAINLKLIKLGDVIKLLKTKPYRVEIVLTGRNASPKIIKLAELVSEIKEIKHYFNSGVKGRKGIEF